MELNETFQMISRIY